MKLRFPIKFVMTVGIIVIGVYASLVINFHFIDNYVIGDSCKFDISQINTGFIFNLFYEVSSNTGYHPDITLFNLVFTGVIGITFGLFISYKLFWKSQLQNN